MAQDFGDDMGNALLNFVTRQTENYLRFGRGRERAFDWWQRHYKKEGNTPEQAKAMAEKQSSREQVVVPFGTSEEAAYYAQVCRENGTYAAAYTDKQGNGFLAFAKETYDWMRDGLYLSNGDIASLSEVISENEEEIGALVEKAASERAARYAYDHPKLPKGFVTIEQLQGDLDLGDLRDEVEDFDFDGDITEAFGETAEYKVDDNYHALLTWLPDHTEWLEEAEFDGLLEGCKGDIYKMVRMGTVRVLQVRPLRPLRGYLPLRHPRPAKGYGGLCHPGKPCRRNLKRPLL